jgi:predicted LPLAT superfamily acyltransferase
MLCFGLYEGGNRYRLVFEPFAERVDIPRQDRAQALDAVMGHFAARVEHYIRVAPYNWFNFYDFWQQDVDAAVRPDAVAERERVGA